MGSRRPTPTESPRTCAVGLAGALLCPWVEALTPAPYYAYRPSAPPPAYGYYALAPGFAYGSLRIVGAPRDARVFVDGYYAGVVDEYDGVFQRLNLEVGPHRIEIEVPGYPSQVFDVRIEPGRTLTYRAYF